MSTRHASVCSSNVGAVLEVDRAAPTTRFTDALRQRLVTEAIDFLAEVYELDHAQRSALAAVPVRWRRRNGRSAFYLKARHGFDGPHILVSVPRGAVARWSVYRRVRAAWVTPPRGIEMPVTLFAVVVLVHEFTHAIQHGVCGTPKRRYGEVETTRNEIRLIERMAPHLHAQLLPLKGKARGRGAASRADETHRPMPRVPPEGVPPIWPTRMLVTMWNRLVRAPLGLTFAPARRCPAVKAPRRARAG